MQNPIHLHSRPLEHERHVEQDRPQGDDTRITERQRRREPVVRGLRPQKVAVQGDVPLHGRGQVEVVRPRDGHVEQGEEVGGEQRVGGGEVEVGVDLEAGEEGGEGVGPQGEEGDEAVVAGEALQDEGEGGDAFRGKDNSSNAFLYS